MKQLSDRYTSIIVVLAFMSIALNLIVFADFYMDYRSQLDSDVLAVGVLSLEVLPQGVCNLKMFSEWNFISLCADPTNKTVEVVASSLEGKFDYILKWNQSSQSYILWSTYASERPFDEFQINSSYFVHVNTSSATFIINGTPTQNLNISLVEKFNSPSWPYEFNQSISNSLASIASNFTYVLKWNASSQSYLLFSVFAAENDFENISVGEGQFINVNTTSEVLEYNRIALEP